MLVVIWWSRRVQRYQRAHPSWCARWAVADRSWFLLVSDPDYITLLGFTGRVREQHRRTDLTAARLVAVSSGLATVAALGLAFVDGSNLTVQVMRNNGLAGGIVEIQDALAYLTSPGRP